MSRIVTVTVIGLAAGVLSACGIQLEKAQRIDPQGTSFDRELYAEYVGLSSSEFDEADYRDSDVFARRAMSSGEGQTVAPEALEARNLPSSMTGELGAARSRLVAALDGGARESMPDEAARAQGMFDCWMQEQEENFQPEDIARCREGFLDSVAKLEAGMQPPQPVAQPAPPPPPPPAAPPPLPGPFLVFFDFDSSVLSEGAERTIGDIASAIAQSGSASINVAGYTDTSGTAEYNLGLSERRADVVAQALRSAGVSSGIPMTTEAFGEDSLRVPTDDGVREPANRRVQIMLSR